MIKTIKIEKKTYDMLTETVKSVIIILQIVNIYATTMHYS